MSKRSCKPRPFYTKCYYQRTTSDDSCIVQPVSCILHPALTNLLWAELGKLVHGVVDK